MWTDRHPEYISMVALPLSAMAWTARPSFKLSVYMSQSHPLTLHCTYTCMVCILVCTTRHFSCTHWRNVDSQTSWINLLQATPLLVFAWTARHPLELSMYTQILFIFHVHIGVIWADRHPEYTNCYPHPSLSLHGQTDNPWNCPCTCCSHIHGQYTLYIHIDGHETLMYTQTL